MPDPHARVHELFEEAVLQDSSVRREFVREVCGADLTLRRQVEALLDAAECSVVVDRSLSEVVADLVPTGHDSAAMMGKQVGRYRLESLLGRGGMGEVYAATDPELRRQVAIKLLPADVAADRDRVARFRREAQVLAALNHPGIGTIYGVEPFQADQGEAFALVLELVPGPTLLDMLEAGPLPIDDALRIARQIAEALDAAHQQGIVHRDLKPANVKVREDGTVKVLDFGLARPAVRSDDGTAGSVLSFSPTLTPPAMTGVGVILGTAAYMSPEQAKGKPLDKRSDIWAFGAVLYEMVTGTRAFAGDDVVDTLAAIVKTDPDWAPVPPRLQPLLRRCLHKDPKRRLRDIGDGLALLEEAEFAAGAPMPSRAPRWIAAASLSGLAILLVVGGWYFTRPEPRVPDRAAHLALPLPAEWQWFDYSAGESRSGASFAAVSPDGRYIALRGRAADERDPAILLHDLETGQARTLAGTVRASTPFWSPDSRFIAFVADGALKRVGLDGAPPVTITQAPGSISGATWGRGGTIVLATTGTTPPFAVLMQVPAGGGTLTAAVPPAQGEARAIVSHPSFLPDGRHLIYTEFNVERLGTDGPIALYLQELGSSQRVRLTEIEGRNAQYVNGHLLFVRDRTLMAQAFDLERHALTGDARPLAASVQQSGNPQANMFSASDGVLMYLTGEDPANVAQLTWLNRQGSVLSEIGTKASYREIVLAPDGRRAYTSILGRPWIIDLERGIRSRWSTTEGVFNGAAWSPDSRNIAFAVSTSDVFAALHVKPADGSGAEQLLLRGADGTARVPSHWSPDGRRLLFVVGRGPASNNDIWVLPFEGDRRAYPFVASAANEARPKFSPDGRWVAFASDESGQMEVYVVPFGNGAAMVSNEPPVLAKVQVSSAGGNSARWRGDGRELFYVEPGTGRIMAASVDGSGAGFVVREVRHLFSIRLPDAGNPSPYDVSGDGQRFLVAPPRGSDAPPAVVLNWAATAALTAR